VLFNNCWQDYAVRNAASMASMLTDADRGTHRGIDTDERVQPSEA